MKKGYLILFSIIFCLMIIFPLPCLKTAGRQGSNSRKIDSENESFRVIFPDGSICEMSAKDYVFGVLAAEMSPSVPEQALKAQAVCAYTFASRKKADRKIFPPSELDGADISADYHIDQGFLTKEQAREKWGQKADEYEQKLNKIVDETAGVSVRYDGSFALTLYHAISAGRTESAQNVFGEDIPYLVPVQSVGGHSLRRVLLVGRIFKGRIFTKAKKHFKYFRNEFFRRLYRAKAVFGQRNGAFRRAFRTKLFG